MKAIVYTSNTGHTAAYAKMIGEKMSLPVYTLDEAKGSLESGDGIIYLGWLWANKIKGYKKASGRYNISAVIAVGLCDTGTAIPAVRSANSIADDIPVFTCQGGMDKTKLRGINKFMIKMLTKSLSAKKERTSDDERMLELLLGDENYVCEENLSAFLSWLDKSRA